MALNGDMGWLFPSLSRYLPRIRLWNRLLKMDTGRITRKIFEWDYNLCRNNWSSEMKKLFDTLNVDVFNDKSLLDPNGIEDKLYSLMEKKWKEEIIKKPKLRTYRLFKNNVHTEEFVSNIRCRRERSLFSQFRHGILPLKIETGRFKNIQLQDRICEYCDLQEVEDETHFLCNCTLYCDIRNPLFDKACSTNHNFAGIDDKNKFSYLLMNMWQDVSKFVSHAWNIRHQYMYK